MYIHLYEKNSSIKYYTNRQMSTLDLSDFSLFKNKIRKKKQLNLITLVLLHLMKSLSVPEGHIRSLYVRKFTYFRYLFCLELDFIKTLYK